jgi:hypothetical protein
MAKRKLTYEDSIDIWIRFWLRHERHEIVREYEQNPMRVYEIWWEEKFVGSREDAEITFRTRYPDISRRTDFSPLKKTRKFVSRRIAGTKDKGQGRLL